jgi:hypothetical protein
MGGGCHEVYVHHSDEAENQERWQEPKIIALPLPSMPNVEVVL